MNQPYAPNPLRVLQRLEAATDAHDLENLVACFADDYRNETPAHPERSFVGSEQVRRNWSTLFGAMPDLRATVLHSAVDGETVWSEWEMSGTRPDGMPHLMRGVVIFGIPGDRAAWARFYLEPVSVGGGDVDAAVGRAAGVAPAGAGMPT